MKKTYIFSIIFITIWISSVIYILNEIVSLHKYNPTSSVPLFTFIIFVITVFLTVAAVGIGFRHAWARRLYLYTSTSTIILIFGGIIYSLLRQRALNIFLFMYSILICAPWLGLLCFGIYYLNRKDVIETFGLSKNKAPIIDKVSNR